MANGALFIGWGRVIPGREKLASRVFTELIQTYEQFKQQGEIESYEPFLLEPHGGDLAGFLVVRGDLDKLNRLRHSDDFHRLNARGNLVIENLGIVSAHCGEEVQKLVTLGEEQAASLV